MEVIARLTLVGQHLITINHNLIKIKNPMFVSRSIYPRWADKNVVLQQYGQTIPSDKHNKLRNL